MTTVGFAPIEIAGKQSVSAPTIVEEKKSTRQIVREEIQRQKDLDKLEEKYQAGEISEFEYKTGKFLLTAPIFSVSKNENIGKCYSTTA